MVDPVPPGICIRPTIPSTATSRQHQAIRAASGGPSAPSQTSYSPPIAPHSQLPFMPGLRWEKSPYTCISLSDVSDAEASTGKEPDIPRHFGTSMPRPDHDAPPRLPRVQPIALPPQVPGITTLILNPALRLGPRATSASMSARTLTGNTHACGGVAGKAERLFLEVATWPGLPSLTVISPLLPWAITAHASGGSAVAVGDVLCAVHRALEIHVTKEEFYDWLHEKESSSMKHRGERWKNWSPDENPKVEASRYRSGMTRLDLLEGRHRFAGLSESKMGCEVWVVHFM